jgi:hypothetical protein
VVLARHLADPELEQLAFDKLHRLGGLQVEGLDGTFGQAVSRWAKDAAVWTPVDITDLQQL